MKTNGPAQIWITRSHLRALAATSLGLAFLAFFVGVEVGRSESAVLDSASRPTLLPDAASDDALEALLREVESAQRATEAPSHVAANDVAANDVAANDATGTDGAGRAAAGGGAASGFQQALSDVRTEVAVPPDPVDPTLEGDHPPVDGAVDADTVAGLVAAAPEADAPAADAPVVTIPAPGQASMLGVPAVASRPSSGWAVQIASYHTSPEADARVGELRAQGIDAYAIAAMVNGGTWYRVRVGGYATKTDANEGRKALAATLGSPDLVVAPAP